MEKDVQEIKIEDLTAIDKNTPIKPSIEIETRVLMELENQVGGMMHEMNALLEHRALADPVRVINVLRHAQKDIAEALRKANIDVHVLGVFDEPKTETISLSFKPDGSSVTTRQ